MALPVAGNRRPMNGRAAAAPAAPVNIEPKPDRLLYMSGGVLLMYVWRVQDTFPFLGKLQLPMLVAGLSLFFLWGARHPARRMGQLRGPVTTLLILWLTFMVLSVPTGLLPSNSAMFIAKTFLPNVALCILVAAGVRGTRDIEWFAFVNLIGAFIYSSVVNLFFQVGQDGRLGDLVYYDANDLALVIVATIPFAIYFLSNGTGRRKLFALWALAMFMMLVVKSGSRGGFLGFAAVMLYVLLRYRAIPSRTRLFAGLGSLVLFAAVGNGAYWEKIRSIAHPQNDYNVTGEEGRIAIWKRGIGYMMSHPVLGVGVNNYSTAEGRLSESAREALATGHGFKWSVAHNSYVEVGAEVGIPGLIIFLTLLGIVFYRLSRMRIGGAYGLAVGRREMALAQMLTGAFIGFVVCGIFVSAEYYSYLYFLVGSTVGLVKVIRLRSVALVAGGAPRPRVRLVHGDAPRWAST